jgi:hypothetical protein
LCEATVEEEFFKRYQKVVGIIPVDFEDMDVHTGTKSITKRGIKC